MSARAPARKRKKGSSSSMTRQRSPSDASTVYAGPPVAQSPGILILGKQVGSGSFGSVVNSIYYEPTTPESRIINYTGLPLQPRAHYAVKIQLISETTIEMDILRKLGPSPYIMKVYGTGDVPGRSDVNAMVSDMYTQTLKNRISKESILTKKRNFPALVSQMFEAVAVLASKNIIHRDLHSGNIMFGPDPYHNPKIIDFGWSEDTQGRKFKPFTFDEKQPYRLYHPPEQRQWSIILQSHSYRKCTTKFDVYSMAAALIELIYDRTKNDSSLLRSFETLMLSCLFGLSGVELFRNSYGYLDGFDTHRRQHGRANIYPSDSRIVGVVEVVDSRDI